MKNLIRAIALSAVVALSSRYAWATTTTDKIAYGSTTAITCTANSLASSATVGRSSAAVSNTTNLFVDVLVTAQITTGAGTPANDKAIYLYFYGSEDTTTFDEEEGNAPGTDAGYTINSPTIFKGPVVIPILTASKLYIKTFSVAQLFGGTMPTKWGFIVINFSGQTLNSSGNSFSYTGVTYTNS